MKNLFFKHLLKMILPAGLVLLLGVAGAQYAFSQLQLAGTSSQAIVLGGAEYASQSAIDAIPGGTVKVHREDPYVRIEGLGHELVMPIDLDNGRAATDYNTVQLDTTRLKARTATLVGGTLYLPLDTIARGLGAQYRTGEFIIPPSALTNVASRAGKDSDRIVLDLSRDVQYTERVEGNTLLVTIKGVSANTRTYATRGSFVPKFQVTGKDGNAIIQLPLGAGAGYRTFRVIRPGSVRLVIDVGPALPRSIPVLSDLPRAPLIVLDPMPVGSGNDTTLAVARQTAALLTKAGWQVKLTRTDAKPMPLTQREELARRSQVFVSLSLGRFTGAQRQGITIYQPTGEANAQIVNSYRDAGSDPLLSAAVGSGGETKKLSELLSKELGGRGLKVNTQQVTRMYLAGEAPHAAFELELGWPQAAADQAALGTPERTKNVSESLALSVASFLKTRATNLTGAAQ